MSSDQQLNVHISIVNDLCQTNDNPFECYTNIDHTLDDIITANIVLENETVTNCGNKQSQYSKNNGSDTENVETNEYDKHSSAMEENITPSSQPTVTFGEGNEDVIEKITHSGENFQFKDNDVVSRNGVQDVMDVDQASLLQSNIVDPPIRCDVPSQTTHISDQSNEQSSDNFNQAQPQTSLNAQNNEIQEEDNKETNSNKATNEPEVLADELRNISSDTTNQIAESVGDNPSVDDEKIENDTEASNDENEPDSNEDSDAFPDIVDFDGINEVENDEYILDTFVRKPRKERRRIVSIIDDDSDLEVDVERKRLLQSPTAEENKLRDNENVEEDDVDIELLIQNEKPGPKSKKISTQKLKELQTRALLRNAVVIPSSCGKKKKSRIIDSDDEGDNSLLPYCVDVDDIGVPDMIEDNDNEGDLLAASCILLNDIDKEEKIPIENSKQDEGVELNSICAISSYANQSKEIELNKHTKPEDRPIGSQIPENINSPIENNESGQDLLKQSVISQGKHMSPNARSKNETAIICDSGNSTDRSNQQCRKEKARFPPFPSSSSSEDEDEFIPNDVYFGTPDANSKRSSRGKGRPRGRPAQTTSRRTATSQNVERQIERRLGTARRGRPLKREKFIDNRQNSSTSDSPTTSSNESEDEYQKAKARRKPHTVTIVKSPLQLYHNVSLPIQTNPRQQQSIQRQIQRKRDRFYDKSQDIPNAIYFGDVDVPLHVLHSYGDSDSDNEVRMNSNLKSGHPKSDPSKGNIIRFSSQVSRGRGRTLPVSSAYGQMHTEVRYQHTMPINSTSQKARGRPKSSSVSPSNDRSIQMMKKFLKAAGLKKIKLNRLWEGCKSNSERAAKMLELLREKGLEGEPTISKCRQLKVDYLTKKEIEDLDPNLIIQTEGRTRRSVTRAATKRQYTFDEDEILETRTKLSKVIDSDSDFD